MIDLFADPRPLLVPVPQAVQAAAVRAAEQAAMLAAIRAAVKRGGLRRGRGGVVNLHGVR